MSCCNLQHLLTRLKVHQTKSMSKALISVTKCSYFPPSVLILLKNFILCSALRLLNYYLIESFILCQSHGIQDNLSICNYWVSFSVATCPGWQTPSNFLPHHVTQLLDRAGLMHFNYKSRLFSFL